MSYSKCFGFFFKDSIYNFDFDFIKNNNINN